MTKEIPNIVYELTYEHISDGSTILSNLNFLGVKTLEHFEETDTAKAVNFCLSFYIPFNFFVSETEEYMEISSVTDYWNWLQKIK